MGRSDPNIIRNAEALQPVAANDNRTGLLRRFERRVDARSRASDAARFASELPPDATALIEQVERSVTQSGRRRGGWRLRFLPRSRAFVDSLTGWTGSDDTLRHLELSFPTREAAIRYAERHGLAFEVRDASTQRRRIGGHQAFESAADFRLCCWPTGPHALCCGNYPC